MKENVGPSLESWKIIVFSKKTSDPLWERSSSVVECLTRDIGAQVKRLTGVTALWSYRNWDFPGRGSGRPIPPLDPRMFCLHL